MIQKQNKHEQGPKKLYFDTVLDTITDMTFNTGNKQKKERKKNSEHSDCSAKKHNIYG